MTRGKYTKSDEHRKALAMSLKGRKLSKDHRAKLREAQERNPHYPPSRKGEKMSEGAKKKISLFNLISKKRPPVMFGENHPNWKGGAGTLLSRKVVYESKRRCSKVSNGGSHTFGEWVILKAQYNWTCPCCKRSEPEIKLTQDHVIPISRGGSDNIENIQPLCRSCNSRKKVKDTKYEI